MTKFGKLRKSYNQLIVHDVSLTIFFSVKDVVENNWQQIRRPSNYLLDAGFQNRT